MRSEEPDDELPFIPRKNELKSGQVIESWRHIRIQLGNGTPRKIRSKAWRVAAFITAVCICGGIYLALPRYRTIETAYGEIEKVRLPDGSLVVLNSNSRLKYARNWEEGHRFVYLDGEAFFEVAKKPSTRAKFTVHTRLLDVEVLGTVFNVNAGFSDRTEVSLNEGKVLVRTKRELPGGKTSISMEPGEVVVVEEGTFSKTKDAEVEERSAWVTNDFYFDGTPLSEVATMIERKYGYHVYFKHDSLRSLKLSGNMHAENFLQFEKALEITMKLNLAVRSDTLIIANKP